MIITINPTSITTLPYEKGLTKLVILERSLEYHIVIAIDILEELLKEAKLERSTTWTAKLQITSSNDPSNLSK